MWLTLAKLKVKKTKGEKPEYEVIDKNYQALQFNRSVVPGYTGPSNEFESGPLSSISPSPEQNIYAKKNK